MKWPISRWSYKFLFCLITAASVLLSAVEANAGDCVNSTHAYWVNKIKIRGKNNTAQIMKLHFMLDGQRQDDVQTLIARDKDHKMFSDQEGTFGVRLYDLEDNLLYDLSFEVESIRSGAMNSKKSKWKNYQQLGNRFTAGFSMRCGKSFVGGVVGRKYWDTVFKLDP